VLTLDRQALSTERVDDEDLQRLLMQIAIQIPTPQVARWLHTSLGKLVAEWEAGEPMPLPILPLMPLLTG
jgi:hypothetical protein